MERNHRQFIKSSYPHVKKANPDLPILIREAQGTPARAFARFGKLHTLVDCTILPASEGGEGEKRQMREGVEEVRRMSKRGKGYVRERMKTRKNKDRRMGNRGVYSRARSWRNGGSERKVRGLEASNSIN